MVIYSKQYANFFGCLLWAVVAVWPNIASIIDQSRVWKYPWGLPSLHVLNNKTSESVKVNPRQKYAQINQLCLAVMTRWSKTLEKDCQEKYISSHNMSKLSKWSYGYFGDALSGDTIDLETGDGIPDGT